MAPELAMFQPGVGKKPVVTCRGILRQTTDVDDIDNQVRLIANHEKSVFELNAERETKEILESVEKAVARGLSG